MNRFLPEELRPADYEPIRVAPHVFQVAKALIKFKPWVGDIPGGTYGGKAVLDAGGEPAFAEIAILRAFERSGWAGVWVDSYRKAYRRSCWGEKLPYLPPYAANVFETIRSVAEKGARCWDVFCWRDDGFVVFVEAKRAGRDHFRESQVAWLRGPRSGLGGN